MLRRADRLKARNPHESAKCRLREANRMTMEWMITVRRLRQTHAWNVCERVESLRRRLAAAVHA